VYVVATSSLQIFYKRLIALAAYKTFGKCYEKSNLNAYNSWIKDIL